MSIPISALIHDTPNQDQQERVYLSELFGRRYYTWKDWMYPFSSDKEQDQLWIALSALIYEALNDKLHAACLRTDPGPLHILDVGYWNSEWNFWMADNYPDAQITGIDLVPPPGDTTGFDNVNNMFPVDFTNEKWPLPPNSQDLVHISMLCGSVPSWEKLYKTAFKYIKPGAGQIEHVEIDWQPRSYPANFPEDARIVQQWWNCLKAASSHRGSSIAFPDTTEQSLEAAGFVDITRRKTRVPFYCKEGDPKEFQLNKRYRAAMCNTKIAEKNAFTSLSMMFLTEVFGMSEEKVRDMCKQVAHATNKSKNPLYNYIYVYTARKPVREPDEETAPPESHADFGASGWDFDGRSRLKRKRTR